MTVIQETNDELILTGVLHRFTGIRWAFVDGDVGELRDRAVIVETTSGGAMLSELDRIALARWVLAGMPYSIEALPEPESGPEPGTLAYAQARLDATDEDPDDDESGYDGP